MNVSIGIPFLNAEETLADAVRSIFAQTHQDWELILVDDGSSDRSLEIARSIKDPRVRVISDGVNRKLPARLNQIVREAQYPLVARMDADDLISPQKIATQLEYFHQPEIQIVTTGIATLSNLCEPLNSRICVISNLSVSNVLSGRGILHAPIIGRKSWFLKNPYDETNFRAEDVALWCSAIQNGNLKNQNVIAIEKPLYYYRESCGDLRRVLKSHSDVRTLIKRYGRQNLGYFGTAKHLLKSYLKSAIYRTALPLGLGNYIVTKRGGVPLNEAEKAEILADISLIKGTPVPGL